MTETVTSRLQHIVLMKFPSELTADEAAELRAIVLSLPNQIDELLACRFGPDLDGSRTQGFHYLLFTEFRDKDALAAYVVNPAHQVLVRWLDTRECLRLAFDYYLDASTDAFA